jgi:transcriptional regulator ATRX
MGLGKTLQVITLLHSLLTYSKLTKTKNVIVLMPMNVCLNWLQEFNKWLKDCSFFKVYEITNVKSLKDRLNLLKEWQSNGGVFLLSYHMFKNLLNEKISPDQAVRDEFEKYLINPGADLIVCDEGHILKNSKTVYSKHVNRINTKRRIILSGSPLQNNLEEYYCMVSFIKPNILGTVEEFRNRFVNPIYNGQHNDSTIDDVQIMKRRSHVLHKTLCGWVQRMDHNVIKPLIPNKCEYVISIRLSEMQKTLYKMFLESHAAHKVFIDFQNLYRIWTHPWLLKVNQNKKNAVAAKRNEDEEMFIEEESNSMQMSLEINEDQLTQAVNSVCKENNESLDDIINQSWWNEFIDSKIELDSSLSGKICNETGEKVIVFSQFVFTLDLIESFLKHWKSSFLSTLEYFRFDGSTDAIKRAKYVNEFNNPDSRVKLFLISTKAGGIGINLIGANRVILFDASWNPVHDLQSIFRVYRLGQKKPVFIYRFIAQGTMEEKIYNRQINKQSLSMRVVDEHQLDRHFKSNELRELYSFEPDPNSITELKDYAPPVDHLLADLLKSSNNWISKYHEHDSLLVNRLDEGLTELDRINAWQEYENEKLSKFYISLINYTF